MSIVYCRQWYYEFLKHNSFRIFIRILRFTNRVMSRQTRKIGPALARLRVHWLNIVPYMKIHWANFPGLSGGARLYYSFNVKKVLNLYTHYSWTYKTLERSNIICERLGKIRLDHCGFQNVLLSTKIVDSYQAHHNYAFLRTSVVEKLIAGNNTNVKTLFV